MTRTDDQLVAALAARARREERIDTRHSGSRFFPPVSLRSVKLAEGKLGIRFPDLLTRVYTEVCNGCIGPGYGLVGLARGYRASEKRDLIPTVADFRRGEHPDLLPLWDWGDAIWSCVDLGSPDSEIVCRDNTFGPIKSGFTLRSWLWAWLDGQNLWTAVYEDAEREMINPFTRQPMKIKVAGRAKGRPWKPGVGTRGKKGLG